MAGVLAAGSLLGGGAAPAAAQAVLYASASGTGDCSSAADACALATALAEVTAGGTIELVTAGDTARYVGNWTVSTTGAPVAIEAAPGLGSAPILDGDGPDAPAGETCSTASCAGPVLTVPARVHVRITGLTIADGDNNNIHGGGGGISVAGSVAVADSTLTGNTAYDGGAIDNGDFYGFGWVSVVASTFTGNFSPEGGAIDNGDNGGGGSVSVVASTFTGNTAANGGAIDNGDYRGFGRVSVVASTFTGNTAADGGAIDSGEDGGLGAVWVAADVFSGSCYRVYGTWHDAGYNVGSDASCFTHHPRSTDKNAGSVSALKLGGLASNGGPTRTVRPAMGSPVIRVIPDPATITVRHSPVALCPATDQRGKSSAPGTSCDAGAVQTSAEASLTMAGSTTSTGYRHAGDTISYRYRVTNTGTPPLHAITISDSHVPDVSCPAPTLAPATSETCTGSYTVTAQDVASGSVTDTATATATTPAGRSMTSGPSSVTVTVAWPARVSGVPMPHAGGVQGFYLGAVGSTWTLKVTQPGVDPKTVFTGTITVNTGPVTKLTPLGLSGRDSVRLGGKIISFRFPNYGGVNGIRFTAARATSITFTLQINGQPAPADGIYLGRTFTQSGQGSPLTLTR